MIIRDGFVRDDIGTWRNLETVKYFDVRGDGEGNFSIIAFLRDFDPEDFPEEDGEWHICEFGSYDECKLALDAAFGWAE